MRSQLTALIALRDPERGQRYAVRWLKRWLEETTCSLADVAMVTTVLVALDGASLDALAG